MKVLIIDDERLARDELRDLLHIAPDVEIVGEAAHAETARALIATTQPDLLLLDIQMPGPDGFTLLATLPLPVPAVIFVTAHDSHALHAFRVNALDYLLKPIEPDQLRAALARVRDHLACRHAQATVVPPGKLSAEDTVFVRDGERCWFVAIKNIRFAECVGNYCRLHMDAHRPLLLTTLDALAARLDPRRFVRASRSQLINLAWVARTAATPGGGIIATLLDGTAITFSRRAAREFRQQHRLHPHVKNPRPL